ncbi:MULTISPECIES: glutathione S-transferase N-terminal domain-containing protein [Sphingobium]|uniref:Glutathione S-transferase n=2 Tax=Sphingobium TaxID=165695 RepID=A0A8E0WNG5_9SPHN|nr:MULTISPECIES: glutathione S-transferase N-terminal domain-containing protein [Sphingobium]EPR12548.1 hypothetical protein M527_01320 [Sphingobium indicum IP26]AMK20750.1 glutathione S-transferase [Sphingobium sp. MI1205]AMK21409.1 glutathione S-transferase [Sphingobium sp. TKS]EQB03542.1 hypothetical protein L286_12485 [Sphingobium sp. HDIP04]EQB15492.1 hypothetical protein RLDS_11290 [Sphingobium lactosutens DS20]
MHTLYYSPGACSLASHIALAESGLAYRLTEINTKNGDNRTPDYLRINRWGKVPALLLATGEVITEGPAILTHIADSARGRALLPEPGTVARARAMEWLAFLSSTVHPAFRNMFRAERVAGDSPQAIDSVREHGIAALGAALEEADHRIGASDFLIGDDFTVCDGYLTVFYLWSLRVPLKERLPAVPKYAAVAQQVLLRPAVQGVLALERIKP